MSQQSGVDETVIEKITHVDVKAAALSAILNP